MDALLTVDDLARRLGAPNLLILDIRSADAGGRAAFEAGHIPGAVHSDYAADGWRAPKGGAPGLLPEPEALSRLLGRLGVEPASDVVVVPAGLSASDFGAAARVYWTLKAAGHPSRAILDGGFRAWTAAGQPVQAGPGRRAEASPYPVRLDPAVRAQLGEVAAVLERGGATLVDARGADFFEGRAMAPQARRPGRLPGAVHVDSAGAYDGVENRLRPRAELERLFAPAGSGPTVSYCNTGHAAATDWFVLSELLGRPDARLYDGSMSEWTQDDARPVATG